MTLDVEALRKLADNQPVTLARIAAHEAFDTLWQEGHMSRTKAYRWLAKVMNLPPDKAHMLQFDTAQCREVIRLVAIRKAQLK